MRLLSFWDGSKTYLASAALAGLGALLLSFGDGTLGLALLAHGGGLAALRHAVARLQTLLAGLAAKLDAEPSRQPQPQTRT